jgi:hypothetical protein
MAYVGVAPSTTTIRLPSGETIALADWIDDKIYGTVEMGNADTAPLEVFSNGRSQPIPGGQRPANRTDTNAPRSGDNGLPKDWEALIYGIGHKIVRAMRPAAGETHPRFPDTGGALSDPATFRTAFDMDRVLFFQFEYNGKPYSNGVFQDYPTGHGFSVFSTNASVEIANNGRPSPRDRVSMVLPIHMRENLSYKGVWQPEAALVIAQAASDAGEDLEFLDVKTYLYGLIKRTVV